MTPFPPGDPAGLTPYLVRDIRPGADSSMSDVYAGQFFPFRGRVFFVADDGTHGLEPWATDGTDEGTRLVKDIAPGPEDGVSLLRGAILDGVLYFPARGGAALPSELWRSDGTGRGTRSLGVLTPGYSLTASGGLVFFGAGEALGRLELWKTDGRGRGTALVSPIQPGAMVDWRGRLFLMGEDARYGTELWRTDGTAGGTRLVADIQPGTGSGLSTGFRAGLGFGDRIFFAASNGASGEELWAYRPR